VGEQLAPQGRGDEQVLHRALRRIEQRTHDRPGPRRVEAQGLGARQTLRIHAREIGRIGGGAREIDVCEGDVRVATVVVADRPADVAPAASRHVAEPKRPPRSPEHVLARALEQRGHLVRRERELSRSLPR
jgi:hypothetical protein